MALFGLLLAVPLVWPGHALAGNRGQPIHGDFNGDSLADRVVLGPVGNNPICTFTVEYRGSDGTYEPPLSYSCRSPYTRAPYCPDMGVAIDIGGKGEIDLVLTGFDFPDTKGSMFLVRDFALLRQYDGIAFPSTIRTVDFNGDGLQDIWASSDQSPRIASFLNSRDEVLRPGPVNACSYVPVPSHAFADFKGIGNNDMVLSRLCVRKGSFVEVYFGDGSPPAVLISSSDYVGREVYVGDFNHDGVPDVGVIERRGSSLIVRLFTNDGNGVFTELPAAVD
ncbi:hypothetical protein ALI144C_04525 [Actinosynnema sp. ALI-1.44]|nr:hypothetical protein ALI144C_04525 [Actinosynnema sp. ALI-1.44]